MGAVEILKALEKGDKLTAVEIANKINCGFVAVRHGIKRLIKDTSVNIQFHFLTDEERMQRYGHMIGGRKIRIYWIDD